LINTSQYVYSTLINADSFNPHIYKDENNFIYVTTNTTVQNTDFIDLFISSDDGDTWYKDVKLPINDFALYHPKFFIKNDIYYIFAYGKESDKDAIYFIRKFTNMQDKQGNNIDDIWEDSFQKVIFDSRKHCRLTDITTDELGYYAYIAYDKETDNNKYEARFAVYSLTDFSIKMDVSVNENNQINQHHGKITTINDDVIGYSWEIQQQDVYSSTTYQIAYRQYDMITREWNTTIILSTDKSTNHYHQSITSTSDNTVYVTWLNTKPDTIEYYKTNKIFVATIVNADVSNIEEITSTAKANEYPFITHDEYDSLYITYATDNQIQYLTKKINSTKWIAITNLQEIDYKLLTTFCYNNNLYTIAHKDNDIHFVRIDTDLAEDFRSVDDFQIYDINSKEISFTWSKARNAEDIKLQILEEEKNWNWLTPNTTDSITPTTNNVNIVNLTPNLLTAFKIIYKTSDNKYHTMFFDKRLISDYDATHNYNLSWSVQPNTVEQKLYYATELWRDIKDIPISTSEYILKYNNSTTTAFRLNIIGGKSHGYSNIASPLNIALETNAYILTWIPFKNVTKIDVEQSIDGINFYTANINPVKSIADKAIIPNTNQVTYFYRLNYNTDKYSNIVTQTNNLKTTKINYNSVNLQWTTVEEDEITKFQYSLDEGNNWHTIVSPIKNSQSLIRNLKHNTNYWIRLYFPNRFTGKYSNIVKFTTQKHPVEDFKLHIHPNVNITNMRSDKKKYLKITDGYKTITEQETNIPITTSTPQLKFITSNQYSDIKIHYIDVTTNTHKEILLSKIADKQIQKHTALTNEIYFTLPLDKGVLYNIYIETLNSSYGNSEPIYIQTVSNEPCNLSVQSTQQHTINFTWENLDKITNDNSKYNVRLYYSNYNNADLTDYVVIPNISKPFVLSNLMQDTEYTFQLEVCYGKNFGRTEYIKARTQIENFLPVYGKRNHRERAFAFSKRDNKFYIFDRGKLYTYTDYNNQALICDYNIPANNIYADMLSDKNGYIHLIFTYGKYVYYCTNVKDEDNKQHNIENKILIENNVYVNEYLYPNITMEYNKNLLYIVWQEDYGTFSTVSLTQYRNAKPLFDNSMTMLNNNLYNNFPKIRLTHDNGFRIFAIDSANRLQIVTADIDNDYTSDYYLELSLGTEVLELENAVIEQYNDYDAVLDNLDNIRFIYDSKIENAKTSTYATYIDDKMTIESTFFNKLSSTKLFAYDEFVLIGKSDTSIMTSKYIAKENEFSDLIQESYQVEENPLFCIADKNNIYILTTKNGLFHIYTKPIKDIINNNNYISGKWIDNKFNLQNESLRVQAECWSNGDTNDYPQLYIKVNNKVKEITPVNENGFYANQSIKVNSFEELPINDSKANGIKNEDTKMMIKLVYNNNEEIIMDITDMLYYTWDNHNMINKFSH